MYMHDPLNIEPYLVSLDYSKAFPSCRWNKLFGEMEEHLPPLVIRVILHSYINQQAYVKWGRSASEVFEVSNGTGEGKNCSPIFQSIDN